jgi:hypothetical protein
MAQADPASSRAKGRNQPSSRHIQISLACTMSADQYMLATFMYFSDSLSLALLEKRELGEECVA